ncbi:DUF2628 domain-containing protein [Nitratireductor sp. B36]|uniref:DUF2628 domain-containing protein n=1 Tax=Nitratireductor sp. B36 TaxID=2762059 RepID=UPI001E5578BA|nr:DUF2628 domain-containing protein [Nitratireductor sp. B36]MCC5779904.1 DUF2628 domain-containing protein [Nitratireductor sp. B36]
MASYVVMEPPEGGPEQAILVRDGFALLAFIMPFLWFLWHRMWLEALAALAAALLIGATGTFEGWSAPATVASLCLSLFLALEARNLRVAMLSRRGWREWGVVDAANRDEAETRYMAGLLSDEPEARRETPLPALRETPGPARIAGRASEPALGLFTYPGAR